MRNIIAGISLSAALAMGGAAQAQALAAAALRSQDGVAPPSQAIAEDYKIGPEDTLEINVFQLNDLNRQVHVDANGRILLPLLGQMQAGGRTATELSGDIATKLAATYVKDPQVTVTIKDAQGERITVDGAVNQPGVFTLTGPTTLMQAVALAKGPDPHVANMHKVIVFRGAGAHRTTLTYDLQSIRTGRAVDPPIVGKDVVMVDTSAGRSFLRDLVGVSPLVSVLRWGW